MVLTSDLVTNRPLQITLSNNSQTSDSFLCDSKGERIQKVQTTNTDSSVISYVRGKGAKVLAEYDASNMPQTYYIQGPMGLISLYDVSSQQNSFIIRDHLRSTRVAYNATTNQMTSYYGYDCFGNIFIADGSYWNNNAGPRYLYTGQEWDQELGLYNYHARQYDPLYTRRFLSPDPAHQFASPYVYAGNNPINYIDKDGRMITLPTAPDEIGAYIGYTQSDASQLPTLYFEKGRYTQEHDDPDNIGWHPFNSDKHIARNISSEAGDKLGELFLTLNKAVEDYNQADKNLAKAYKQYNRRVTEKRAKVIENTENEVAKYQQKIDALENELNDFRKNFQNGVYDANPPDAQYVEIFFDKHNSIESIHPSRSWLQAPDSTITQTDAHNIVINGKIARDEIVS